MKDKNGVLKKVVLLLILVLISILFYTYGRSIYMPIVHKIKGKGTVDSVISKIQDDVQKRLEPMLSSVDGTNGYPDKIILVAFKEEQKLEVYAQTAKGNNLIKTYPFTASSGQLGPKLKEGDKQIPEGVYRVEYLNPNSSYYLSIKINYPNAFDISKSTYEHVGKMGGDIFIHGKSASIGCIAIGDEAIEEVFFLVQKAFNQTIDVIISPRDFRLNSSYPEIETIAWETELYDQISDYLNSLN